MGKDKVGDKGRDVSGGGGSGKEPRLTREGTARQAARFERSAEALRDNLRKRKARARALAKPKSGDRSEKNEG